MNTAASSDLEQKILIEQVKLLYRPILPVLAANLLVSFALILGLWSLKPHNLLIGWFGTLALVQIFRYLLYLYYQRRFQPSRSRQFATYFTVGACVSGIVWGSSGVLLFADNSLSHQLFLVLALLGMASGANTTQQSYLPAFYCYFYTILSPIILVLFVHGEIIQYSIAIMLIAYLISISYYALNIHRSLIDTLLLRFENIDLVAQLREQKDEAEWANLAKSKFLAAASHDLRQPLHALSLFTSVLNDSNQTSGNRKVVGQIVTTVHALESLFNALLDISRLDAGTMLVEKSHFSLQSMLDRLANDFDRQASEKGLHIIWPKTNLIIYSDINLFEQILRNFISNAIRYTPAGHIEIRCRQTGKQVLVEVIDTGIGIPQDKQNIIFEEFQQLTNPERDRNKGLGLGLAIVKRVADLLEHSVSLQSEPSKGSTFLVTADLGNPDSIKSASTPDNTILVNESHSRLVAVIDDEVNILEGMQNLLESWGYQVVTAVDLNDGLNKLSAQQQTPDAIIVDYRLRENKTGIEAIQALHAHFGTKIPALIVTGDTAVEQLREVAQSGFQVLHKPVAPGKLRAFLRHLPTSRVELN